MVVSGKALAAGVARIDEPAASALPLTYLSSDPKFIFYSPAPIRSLGDIGYFREQSGLALQSAGFSSAVVLCCARNRGILLRNAKRFLNSWEL